MFLDEVEWRRRRLRRTAGTVHGVGVGRAWRSPDAVAPRQQMARSRPPQPIHPDSAPDGAERKAADQDRHDHSERHKEGVERGHQMLIVTGRSSSRSPEFRLRDRAG